MAIRKTVIEITILHQDTDDVTAWDLNTIGGEMNEGCILGTLDLKSSVEVLPHLVKWELDDIGNDGTFFDQN